MQKIELSDIQFMQELINSIVDERNFETPSEYIEQVRFLPRGTSPKPGMYNFDYTPYLKEPFDHLSQESPAERIIFMKSTQIGYTVGYLQNAILYHIGSDPRRVQFVTADKDLAEETVKMQINPMIEHAGLEHLIFAQSKTRGSRATGSTMTLKEYPGGYAAFRGAKNPDKARGRTFQVSLFDEIDTFKDDKKEGSILSLFEDRSKAFALTRKMVYGSTPLIEQSSKIYKLYKEGDQRHFYVPCPRCGEMIVLYWHFVSESGGKYGIVFDHENGEPIYESVAYKCQKCGGHIKDHEKVLFMAPDVCEWRPTATSPKPRTVSYWINALYSPVGMFPWERMVEEWTKCWDLVNNKLKDKDEYRKFRNTMQGLPYKERGESVSYDKAIIHRRSYPSGVILNKQIIQDTGNPILIVVCSVDVQKNNLYVDIKGYTYGGRTYTLEFFSIDGAVEDYKSPVWSLLYDLLANKTYTDEMGHTYRIMITFIDSSKYTEYVYAFCAGWAGGVYPIKGERYISGGVTYRMMSKEVLEKSGCSAAYRINTTRLKDRIAYALNRLEWTTGEHQPDWYPNFPEDLKDDYFRQFEAEQKVDAYDTLTNQYKGSYWKQISGRDNHAFDTAGYNLAALELQAEYICKEELGLHALNWKAFWDQLKFEFEEAQVNISQ